MIEVLCLVIGFYFLGLSILFTSLLLGFYLLHLGLHSLFIIIHLLFHSINRSIVIHVLIGLFHYLYRSIVLIVLFILWFFFWQITIISLFLCNKNIRRSYFECILDHLFSTFFIIEGIYSVVWKLIVTQLTSLINCLDVSLWVIIYFFILFSFALFGFQQNKL